MVALEKNTKLALLCATLVGCNTLADAEPVPAVLTSSSAEIHAELERVVSRALNGIPVTLAPDILTKDSALIIERAPHRSIDNLPVGGRTTERPHHFTLLVSGSACLLLHKEKGATYALENAQCAPVSTD